MKVVCSPDYPLQQTELTLDELCRERLLLREPGSAIRDTLESQLYLAGKTVYPLWCSVNDSALLAAAVAGLGIAILPETYVLEELKKTAPGGTLRSRPGAEKITCMPSGIEINISQNR